MSDQPTVTREQAGTYRQVTHTLRIQGRAGRAERESTRPRHPKTGHYLDSTDAPTLVELRVGDPLDVPWLLMVGAIQPYTPPRAPRTGKEASDVRES